MKTIPSTNGIQWEPVSLDAAREARERTREIAVRTPLVRFDYDTEAEIYLKLELLQPIRAFKLRGAANAILAAGREGLAEGVWTSSAGNMAQGVCYAARELGIPAVVYMPDTAPQAKIDNVQALWRRGAHAAGDGMGRGLPQSAAIRGRAGSISIPIAIRW